MSRWASCTGKIPENGDEDVTIHRMCLQGPDTLSVWFSPGRHIDVFRAKAEAAGKPLPVSVSIGLDPAIYLGACFEPPMTPIGFNELAIAGALRGRAVEQCACLTVDAKALAWAEYVIEGEILPNVRIAEDAQSGNGKAMPEFPGYCGPSDPQTPVMRVTAVTHRLHPIMQTTIGPSEEHVNLAGIPTEASILGLVERAMPGRVRNVYAASWRRREIHGRAPVPQGHHRRRRPPASGRPARVLGLPELKHVFLVDDDVDPFDMSDVLWAMTTRYQGNLDTVFLPGVRGHVLASHAVAALRCPHPRTRGRLQGHLRLHRAF